MDSWIIKKLWGNKIMKKTSGVVFCTKTKRFKIMKKAASGVMIFCTKTKRFLFPFRSDKVWDPSTWGVWGGHKEPGENFKNAAARELQEETGIEIDPDHLELLFHNSKRLFIVLFEYSVFLLEVEEEFEPDINWETDHSIWLSFDMFPQDNLSVGLKRVYESIKCMEKFRELSK